MFEIWIKKYIFVQRSCFSFYEIKVAGQLKVKLTVGKDCVLSGSDLDGCTAASAMLSRVNCRNGNQTQLFTLEHKFYETSKI